MLPTFNGSFSSVALCTSLQICNRIRSLRGLAPAFFPRSDFHGFFVCEWVSESACVLCELVGTELIPLILIACQCGPLDNGDGLSSYQWSTIWAVNHLDLCLLLLLLCFSVQTCSVARVWYDLVSIYMVKNHLVLQKQTLWLTWQTFSHSRKANIQDYLIYTPLSASD